MKILSLFHIADMTAMYLLDDENQRVGLQLVPTVLEGEIVQHREFLTDPEITNLPQAFQPVRAWNVDSLVQLSIAGDRRSDGFAQGRTMRNCGTTQHLKFSNQRTEKNSVVTVLESERGFRCEHKLNWRDSERALSMSTEFINTSSEPLPLEMLSSFSLGCITPFHDADAPERLCVHRFRSSWSAEGRLESRLLEDLQLERSWIGHNAGSERFGQVGSMPVRDWFPFAAVEDTKAGVTWAAQLAWLGSWQMEIYRRDDFANLSGGLADREFGHWMKIIEPDFPIAEENLLLPARLIFRKIEEHDDDAVQLGNFLFAQVVLRHGHVALADKAALP